MQDFRWSDLDHERHLIRVERALLAAGAASAEDRVGHPLGAAGVVASDRRLTVLTQPVVLPSSDSGSLTVQVSVTGVPYQPPEPGLAGLSVAEMRGGVVSAMIVIVRLFVSDPSRLLAAP